MAYLFATRGLEIPYPDDVLFVHRAVYRWALRLERAIAAAGLGRLSEANADLRKVLEEPGLPAEIDEYARQRLTYIGGGRSSATDGGAPVLSALVPGLRIGEIKLQVTPAWPHFNPSIAPDGDGFRMIVRTANYSIERGVLHADGVLHNVNYLVSLDQGLAAASIEQIVDRSSGPVRYPTLYQGYEDCRLVKVGDSWYATATACDLNPIDLRQMVLLHLEGAGIAEVLPLAAPHPERHQKNWMPFVVEGGLHFVYSCGPTVVLGCQPATGRIQEVAESPAPHFASELRGGSQGVKVDDGFLFAVHEVDRSGSVLRYLHRFVLLDDAMTLAAASRPFRFTSDRVEFCAGAARRDGDLILSFGVSDAAAGLAVMPLAGALGLLEPVDAQRS